MPNPTPSDAVAGFQVGPAFEAFTPRNHFYRRSFWGANVRCANTKRFYRAHRQSLAHHAPQGFGVRAFCNVRRACMGERLAPRHGWKSGKARCW